MADKTAERRAYTLRAITAALELLELGGPRQLTRIVSEQLERARSYVAADYPPGGRGLEDPADLAAAASPDASPFDGRGVLQDGSTPERMRG
jgi:hypothetical protein